MILPTQPDPTEVKESLFIGNLAMTGNFYKAMIMTFGNPKGISDKLAEKSQILRRYLASKRPDIDQNSWIHSWQEKSTREEQVRVANLLGF